jgi:hypothetical protein
VKWKPPFRGHSGTLAQASVRLPRAPAPKSDLILVAALLGDSGFPRANRTTHRYSPQTLSSFCSRSAGRSLDVDVRGRADVRVAEELLRRVDVARGEVIVVGGRNGCPRPSQRLHPGKCPLEVGVVEVPIDICGGCNRGVAGKLLG